VQKKRNAPDLSPRFPSFALTFAHSRKLLENASPVSAESNLLDASSCVAFSLFLALSIFQGLPYGMFDHLQNHTAAASAAFLAGIVGANGALTSRLAGTFCFVFEQVGRLDGHVDNVGVLQGEGKV
jgi:nitrate/nitrite transporter NarK